MTRTETNEIARELYLVPPAGFVAARDEVVRQSHAAGARELARELRTLRRPTLSAWLVNLLAHHERASMQHLLAIGRELRDAQDRLDTVRLRRLAGQRQQLIAELLDRARHRAAEAGVRPSEAALTEVEATLRAALVDLAAASTVLSGRLVRPMSHSGFGPTPSLAALSRPAPAAELPAGELDVWDVLSPTLAATDDEQDVWEVLNAPPEAESDEERDVRRAAAELAVAESAHWQREFELADAEGAVDAARERVEWLDTQRFQARRDRVTAERHLADAKAAQQLAVRVLEDARRALEAAERRLRGDS